MELTDKDMYNGIKEQIADHGSYYFLLDAVQDIDGWEKLSTVFSKILIPIFM